jgi:3-deoxy-D-manno-octulosonic-acid transferase
MVEFLYRCLNIFFTPIAVINLIYRSIIGKEDYNRILERFGMSAINRPKGKLVWIHAASVGETMSISSLIDVILEKNYQIVLTTYTLSAAKIAEQKYSSKVIHQFIPVENYFAIKNFLNKWRPNIALFVESEFWPMIVYETAKKSKIISLNTRISEKSFKKWQKISFFAKNFLGKFDKFYPQSEEVLGYLNRLGLENAEYIGNLKYVITPLAINKDKLNILKQQVKDRHLFLVFSTHETEEEMMLDIYMNIQKNFSDLLLIIVPRHPNRSEEIGEIIKKRQLQYSVRSKNERITDKTQIYLADTIGELGLFFSLAKITIVGGSFRHGIGGHNPIEPAKMGAMAIMGPQYFNFIAICKDFIEADAIIMVSDINECQIMIENLLRDKSLQEKYIKNANNLVKSKAKILPKLITELQTDL